ncbi:MAG: NUDIX hydrolase [Acetobacteraceae bacterium]
MPDDAAAIALPRPPAVRARHAASLLVVRTGQAGPEVLMGVRGGRHRFMPHKLVFPGGAVDRADLVAPAASPLSALTRARLERAANPALAHAIGIAAARELTEETGLSLGDPPALAALQYLCRMITPPAYPIRFNARFLLVGAEHVGGTLAGSGELEGLRFLGLDEALGCDLAEPQRRVIERLPAWLAMSETARAAETRLPVFRRRAWGQE